MCSSGLLPPPPPQVTALLRRGDDIEAVVAMAEGVDMLTQFPPPPGCPELELVAAGLRPSTTEAEREKMLEVFKTAGGDDILYLARECLGLGVSA